MASRTKNSARNIFFGFIYNIVAILFPFLTRTVLIYTMGVQYVGLGSLFTSLLGVLNLAEAGIGSALVYKMYKPVAEGDVLKVCALYNFYKKCYRVIGAVILVLGLFLMPFLRFFVKSSLPPDVNLYVLYIVYLSNTVLSYFLFAYKDSLLIAHQRNDVTSKISTVVCVLTNVLELVMLFLFRNYYCYVIIIPVMTIVTNLIRSWYVDRTFPEYVCRGNIEKEEVASLKTQVGGLLFSRIGDIVLTNVDTVVISAFLGLTVLGKYNNYYYIVTSLFAVLGIITSSIAPSVGNMVFTKAKKELLVDYEKFSFIFIAICSWFSACYLCLVQPFIELWIGKENQLDMFMAILMTVYLYTSKINDMTWVYRQASGLWWEGRWIPLISAIFNLVVNLILVQLIGLPGIVISTILSRVLISLPAGSHNLFRVFFHDRKAWLVFMGHQIWYGVSAAVAAVASYGFCGICSSKAGGSVWAVLVISALICLIFPMPIFCLLNIWNRPFKLAVEYFQGIFFRLREKRRLKEKNV